MTVLDFLKSYSCTVMNDGRNWCIHAGPGVFKATGIEDAFKKAANALSVELNHIKPTDVIPISMKGFMTLGSMVQATLNHHKLDVIKAANQAGVTVELFVEYMRGQRELKSRKEVDKIFKFVRSKSTRDLLWYLSKVDRCRKIMMED